jgi:hypothetical protein
MGPAFTPGTSQAIIDTVTIAHENRGEKRTKTSLRLKKTPVAIVDAAASGSYGNLLLGSLMEGAVVFHGCRQKYTAFAESAELTTAAGDAAFKIGVGSAAIAAAADAVLAAGAKNVGGEIAVTLSGGTGTGAAVTGAGGAHDGATTAAPLYLNVSGSAATIDASGTLYVTGKIDIIWEWICDD